MTCLFTAGFKRHTGSCPVPSKRSDAVELRLRVQHQMETNFEERLTNEIIKY